MKYWNININYHCKIVLPVSNFQPIEYVLILHLDKEPISGVRTNLNDNISCFRLVFMICP